MCGRFMQAKSPYVIAEQFQLNEPLLLSGLL